MREDAVRSVQVAVDGRLPARAVRRRRRRGRQLDPGGRRQGRADRPRLLSALWLRPGRRHPATGQVPLPGSTLVTCSMES